MSASWLITGGSSGLGLSLGRTVLTHGGMAILTTRNLVKARAAAPDVEELGGRWLELDYAHPEMTQIIRDAVVNFNVTVVVNNAGSSMLGAVEDFSPEALQAQFEGNVFGPVRVIQAVIPLFRELKAGTIINIGSSVSYTGNPALGVYSSTKAALRIITEGLTAELGAFGIRVLLFEPGRFRTNFGANGTFAKEGDGYSEVYKGTPVEGVVGYLRSGGQAPGDPNKAALRIYEVTTNTGLAANGKAKDLSKFALGPDARQMITKAGQDMVDGAEATAEIANSTDF